MKRVLVFLVLVLALVLVGCMANPAVVTGGNSASYIAGDLLQIDMNVMLEALRPYLDAWGPYDLLQTFVCRGYNSYITVAWGDDDQGLLHYVKMVYIDGEWIVAEASEIVGIKPASTT